MSDEEPLRTRGADDVLRPRGETPWGTGLTVAVFVAAVTAGAIVVLSLGLTRVNPLLAVGLNLVAVGMERFRLLEQIEGQPYAVGRVQLLSEPMNDAPEGLTSIRPSPTTSTPSRASTESMRALSGRDRSQRSAPSTIAIRRRSSIANGT